MRKLARAEGFEPSTNRLTADRSTTELRSSFRSETGGVFLRAGALFASVFLRFLRFFSVLPIFVASCSGLPYTCVNSETASLAAPRILILPYFSK